MQYAQAAAVRVLTQVLAGRNLDHSLEIENGPQTQPYARALMHDLCYGVLRHLGLLDAQLSRLAAKPLKDEPVRQLLRIALYQLQYTRSAPHAVVDHAVRACADLRVPAAKGLVNAILRGYLRRAPEMAQARHDGDDTARYSFPKWWVEKLRAQYPAHFETMLLAGNQHPPLTLRVNLRKGKVQDYLARLAVEGIAARAVGPQGVVIAKPMPAHAIPGLAEGQVSVQDAAAQWAAPLLEVRSGMRVLDACAAPGGKTSHLLELADIHLTALDHDAHRLTRVESNLKRLGLSANIVCGDAATPQTWWDGQLFDRILADVPCTASGVTRRHPDIKWTRRPSDILRFAAVQEALLDALWRLLAAGGKFLYVTCSVFEEENQTQIARFLTRHADAYRVALAGAPVMPLAPDSKNYQSQILPDTEHDGFFYALLQKA